MRFPRRVVSTYRKTHPSKEDDMEPVSTLFEDATIAYPEALLGIDHSAPGNVLADLHEAIDRRVAEGLIDADEFAPYAEDIERRLLECANGARVRHLVRLSARGR